MKLFTVHILQHRLLYVVRRYHVYTDTKLQVIVQFCTVYCYYIFRQYVECLSELINQSRIFSEIKISNAVIRLRAKRTRNFRLNPSGGKHICLVSKHMVHLTSHPLGTKDFYHGDKAAGA